MKIKQNTASSGESARRKGPGAGLSLTLAALFAALIAAGTFISVPLPFSPVPVVMQNLFSLLAGLVLGPALGAAAVGLYLAAGIIGAPVFAGASGGIARLLGPTGGFLLGYLFSALTAGLIAGPPQRGFPCRHLIPAIIAGLLVVYVPGLIRLYFALGSWGKALTAGFIPFILGDAVKGCIAAFAAPRLRKLVADRGGR
ncbi:MAG: biotin transporter BioY [Treponema sp.]|jgi:biotin transport system substrate-specific component|nr:biotin transporter BioY [Treponema sp.]